MDEKKSAHWTIKMENNSNIQLQNNETIEFNLLSNCLNLVYIKIHK